MVNGVAGCLSTRPQSSANRYGDSRELLCRNGRLFGTLKRVHVDRGGSMRASPMRGLRPTSWRPVTSRRRCSAMTVKTDRRDARGMPELLRRGGSGQRMPSHLDRRRCVRSWWRLSSCSTGSPTWSSASANLLLSRVTRFSVLKRWGLCLRRCDRGVSPACPSHGALLFGSIATCSPSWGHESERREQKF